MEMAQRRASNADQDTRLRAPRKSQCECRRHDYPVQSKFQDEPYANLQCTCSLDADSRRCFCTERPWSENFVSVYAGVRELHELIEFDNPANKYIYRFGRFLHCIVRAKANYTEPDVPPSISLSEYESGVFESRIERPLDLKRSESELASYFRKRTNDRHSAIRDAYVRRTARIVPTSTLVEGEDGDEIDYSIGATSDNHILIETEPGDFLYELYHFPKNANRLTFQLLTMLILTGLAKDEDDAYTLILMKLWPPDGEFYTPNKPKQSTLRSQARHGRDYLRGVVTNPDSRSQLGALKDLARRDGVEAVAPFVFADRNDRKMFVKRFGGVR